MPETIEKTEDITYLPVIYTPQMVLLPFESQSLKIQTAAHRQLIKDVAHSGKFFGLSFLDKETASPVEPEIGSVGCIAEVKRIRLGSSGGKIVDITGVVRYQIDEYVEFENVPYTVAAVTIIEDAPEDVETLRELTCGAGSIISRIFDKVLKPGTKKSGDEPLANMDPLLASFMLADLFNMDNASRQLFLQLRLTSERLKACQENLLRIEDGTDERITTQQFLKPFYSNKHK